MNLIHAELNIISARQLSESKWKLSLLSHSMKIIVDFVSVSTCTCIHRCLLDGMYWILQKQKYGLQTYLPIWGC